MATVIEFPVSRELPGDPLAAATEAGYIVGYFLKSYELLRILGDAEGRRESVGLLKEAQRLGHAAPTYPKLRKLFLEAVNEGQA